MRRLAERQAAIAEDPVNIERRDAWYRLDAGDGDRPLVLAAVGGVRDERSPLSDLAVCCSDPWARGLERAMHATIWQFEVLRDDHVVEPVINVNWQVAADDYGVAPVQHRAAPESKLGARL